jgi:hypothetical protein
MKRKWGVKDETEKDGIEKEEGTGYNDKKREVLQVRVKMIGARRKGVIVFF